jgi:putative ABC transport system substrate-binding protein
MPRFVAALLSFSLLLAAPLAIDGQPARTARIGYIGRPGVVPDALAQGLRDLGYAQKDFVIERRGTGGPEHLALMAADLARSNVDVIVAATTFAALAAKRATSVIPVVTVNADPLGSGLISSLARPGGNVTGLSGLGARVERQATSTAEGSGPGGASSSCTPTFSLRHGSGRRKGNAGGRRTLGVTLAWFQAGPSGDYPNVISGAAQEAGTGLLVYIGTNPVDDVHASRIVELAAQYRLPAIYDERDFVLHAGGLMAFGPDLRALARRAAHYVDRILKGVKPGELPVEQPTKFELVINLKTAKTLGLTIPQSVLLRADEVIQ